MKTKLIILTVTHFFLPNSYSATNDVQRTQLQSTTEISNRLATAQSRMGTGHENQGEIRLLRLELARRGDSVERTRVFSALNSTNVLDKTNAITDAALIGDREAIFHIGEMLNDPTPGGRVRTVGKDGSVTKSRDFAVIDPSMTAALKLSELVDNPPVPPIGNEKKFYTKDDVAAWRKWWETNKINYR